MNELVTEIAQDAASRGIGVFDTGDPSTRNIYVGEWPDSLVEGICLITVPSPPPHQYVDTEYQMIDFWARSPHSDRAMSLLRGVFDLYGRRYNFDTANWHIYWSRNISNIEDASRDSEHSKLYRLSVQFICRNLNNVS